MRSGNPSTSPADDLLATSLGIFSIGALASRVIQSAASPAVENPLVEHRTPIQARESRGGIASRGVAPARPGVAS